MKKLFVLFTLIGAVSLFNSCKKDADFNLENNELIPETTHQARKRTCAMHEHTQKLLEDPTYRQLHQLKFDRLKEIPTDRAACTEPVLLPIAIHFQGISNPDINCLRQLAQSQVDVLNADYTGTNNDISNWTGNAAASFPGVNFGEACVKFCIATKNHPSGYGITNGEPAVTVNTTSGDSDSNWSGYINVFVQANTGVLGYSPLGGSGNGDGVVIDANAFGSGAGCGSISPQAPYNLGRTLTHEMGHYLLLDHIWGNGCGQDDDVSDTPDSAQEYYDCPTVGASSCGSTDMHMNYMDYTNDACMYMFSAGQANRMENYFNSSLQAVINNAANVCEEGNGSGGATCTDGIQNGNETGVDCGGPDCAPCQTEPTCTDGIQNGDETGVDCGGSNCPPCDTGNTCSAPSNVSVTLINPNSVLVTFDGTTSAIEYEVRFRVSGTSDYQTITTTTPFVIIENLQAATNYDLVVQTVCTEGISEGLSSTFSTDDNDGGSCDCEDTHVELALTLDDYPEETTWALFGESATPIAEGGQYTEPGAEISEAFCLVDGCYSLIVEDAYGDGICCDWGNGFFELLDAQGAIIAASDGNFGDFEAIDFCIDNGIITVLELRKAEKDLDRLRAEKPKRNQ